MGVDGISLLMAEIREDETFKRWLRNTLRQRLGKHRRLGKRRD